MKLLIATPLYPPEPGGPSTYAKALEDGLSRKGVEVQVVKFGEVRTYPRVVRHVAYFLKILKAGTGSDVVLALDPVSTGLPAACAAWVLRKHFVVKIVGDFAWEQGKQRFGIQDSLDAFVRRGQVPFNVGLLRVIQTFVAHRATRIIVPSNYLKGIVKAWGVQENKITVIYNAVEIDDLQPVSLDISRPCITTVGRLVPWKGIRGLIDAIALVREKIPDACLMVVGEGPERESLEDYAKEKLGDHVRFTGAKPHAETLGLMKDSDVFVLNSEYEGLSHLLIEALGLGSAIVASDAGGNPELIKDQQNGFLVSVADTYALANALHDILTNGELRNEMKARAAESSKKFSMDTMLSRTQELLSSV
jgi:glycosyltransferase involved in cell wall biosynthesis